MKQILWLASWYPTKNAPLVGDFVQRHALAASKLHEITVLHIKRDDAIKKRKVVVVNKKGNLTERMIIYRPPLANYKFISTILSSIYWFCFHFKGINLWRKQHNQPTFIHVQVAWKCGLIALYYKLIYRIPYVITEHYTGYFPEAKGLLPTYSAIENFFIKKIFKRARQVYTVSDALGEVLADKFAVSYKILHNVVDTSLFRPTKNTPAKQALFTILHVSTLDAHKDPDLLFAACNALTNHYQIAFKLIVIAPLQQKDTFLNQYPSLAPSIDFIAEVTQRDLASYMRAASVLVLSSSFESFGLVAYESIACGTPVIVSDIPVFREFLSGKSFVQFCAKGDFENLATLLYTMSLQSKPDSQEMFSFIDNNFSYKTITNEFKELY